MKEIDLRTLQLGLDKKGAKPLYLIYGEELFLVDEALKAIKARVLNENAKDFNYDSFYAPEVSPAQVRDAVEMLPVMTEQRLVIYRNVDALKEDAWQNLLPVIENPVDSCCLVLVAHKIDKRKKIFKAIFEHGVAVELKKPFENQVSTWVDYIASMNSIKLTAEAISILQQLVGTNLSEIQNEIQKIRSSSNAKKVFDVDDVLGTVSRSRIESVFNLTDAISRRDRGAALLCLANLLENGQNESGIVSLILRQMRILSQVRTGVREGLSSNRLSQKIGVPEFFMKQYVSQSRNWDDYKINNTIRALHETDKALKSSPISSHIWLENFIVKTC
ncbi:MAG: DNA polymerase III subunit delta [Bdellovibrionota bacterium]